MAPTVLRIDSSARREGSVSRALADRAVERLSPARVIRRDLAEAPLPFVDAAWVAANATPAERRTPEQREALRLSDALVAELREADALVIAVATYNFAPPAALKAWIDLVARAGETFRYTEAGPEGLLREKRAVIVLASGGTEVGAPNDFVTPYLRHMLGFMGIEDVRVVASDRLALDPDASAARAEAGLERLAA